MKFRNRSNNPICFFFMFLTIGVSPSAFSEEPLTTDYVFKANVTVDWQKLIGPSKYGTRLISPITGGSFEGPNIKGTVAYGGADWQILRSDLRLDLDARYTLLTDDGAVIQIFNTCLIDPMKVYMRCVPEFEAPIGKYEWLNHSVFVANLIPSLDLKSVNIVVYKLE